MIDREAKRGDHALRFELETHRGRRHADQPDLGDIAEPIFHLDAADRHGKALFGPVPFDRDIERTPGIEHDRILQVAEILDPFAFDRDDAVADCDTRCARRRDFGEFGNGQLFFGIARNRLAVKGEETREDRQRQQDIGCGTGEDDQRALP